MLLLTTSGCRCDPNVSGTSGSGYGELVKTHSSGLFWPGFYAITHCFLVLVRSEHFENPGVWLLCTSSKLALFAYSGPFCMLILTDFGTCCDPNVSRTPGSGYGNSSELAVLAYSRQFCMLLLTDFATAAIRTFRKPRGSVTVNSSKLAVAANCG